MRIKRLELIGFKSSMAKTVLDFPEGITGIVGPNGCGKSNIVDALRWVLGEQSAKHLRGQSMEDVIFAGNQRYPALGACEVTITMDNEDPGPVDPEEAEESSELVRALRGAPELSITRRLFRSGESQYLINGKPCRLRDITELFLGTGVGTKAYSIIEQGRVGQIVAAKPEELRVFIEEAAGTTLYRSRKLAAERKIERTRDNLLRVSDVIRELERQAASLRRQAQGAIRYQELKTRETELDRFLSSGRLRKLVSELASSGCEFATTRGRLQALGLAANQLAGVRDLSRSAVRRAENEVGAVRNQLFDVRSKVDSTRREREYLVGRVDELSSLAEEARRDVRAMDDRAALLDGERSELGAQAEACAAELAVLRAGLKEVQEAGTQHDDRVMKWSAQFEKVKADLVGALAARADLRNERAAVESRVHADEERVARLREEHGSLDTVARRLVQDVTDCQGRLDQVLAELARTKGGKESAAVDLESALGAKRSAQLEAEGARDESAALRTRHESLLELHEAFAGYGDGVRSFMSNGGRERTGAKAVVADVIEIEQGYEQAVAAALDDRLQYVVVPSADAGVEGAFYLRETGAGRASFIPLSPRGSGEITAVPDGFSRLADHLKVSDGYEAVVAPLLDGVVVAEDLEQAKGQWLANGYHATFVTRAGEVIDASGVVTGGSGRPIDAGILERKAELRQLAEALARAQGRYREAGAALETATATADSVSAELAHLDAKLHELTVSRVSAQGDLELRRQNLIRTEERSQSIEREVEEVEASIASSRGHLESISETLSVCEGDLSRLESERSRLEAVGAEMDAARTELRDREQRVRVAEAELRQKHEALEIQAQALENAVAEVAARRESALERVGRSEAEIERCRQRLDSPEFDSSGLEAELERMQGLLAEAEAREVDARKAAEEAEGRRDQIVGRIEELRGIAGRLEVQVQELGLKREALLEGVLERLDLDAAGLAATPAPPEDWSAKDAVGELSAIRSSLRRLGNVNLGAVIELEEIDSRLGELAGQRADLEKSIEDLRGTIGRLNKLSKQRFKETFDDVNRVFREVFPKLFQGGRAELALTDENDLLETGVEIHVQPPGKRLGNLNLLSGGEKAMTAISLIFSLFLHKPSPFCVLDEVDAPLDEANIGRFTSIVSDMSTRSQFLLITHNKRTMEAARRLYGVTMPEPGVTRIVSVDLDTAARHVERTGVAAIA